MLCEHVCLGLTCNQNLQVRVSIGILNLSIDNVMLQTIYEMTCLIMLTICFSQK